MYGEGANEEWSRVSTIMVGEGGLKLIRKRGNGGRRSNGRKGIDNNGGGRGFKSIRERKLIDGEGGSYRLEGGA